MRVHFGGRVAEMHHEHSDTLADEIPQHRRIGVAIVFGATGIVDAMNAGASTTCTTS